VRAGFLLSPVVTAFAALASGKGGGVAKNMIVRVDDPSGFYEPEVGIEFSFLSYAP
jgi:hypothetical protein